MVYLQLFFEFFKIGLFALGGGPATLPFLAELTKHYSWFTLEELGNIVAISESTPGSLGLNMATYAGYHAAGISGGVIATLSLTLPSIIVIIIIAKFLSSYSERAGVKSAFYGIRPAITGLIAATVYGLMRITLSRVMVDGSVHIPGGTLFLFVVFFVILQFKKFSEVHPAVWLIAAALIGIGFKM